MGDNINNDVSLWDYSQEYLVYTDFAKELSPEVEAVTINKTLKEICTEYFPLDIKVKRIMELSHYCTIFELRNDNPLAFNSALIGVHKAHFFDKDQDAIFNIFDVDRGDFQHYIQQCPSVFKERLVTSDPYNIFTTWVIHSIMNDKSLPVALKHQGMFTMCKLLNYKFFTSFVNHSYRYTPDQDIMQYTIDNLSAKFDIKKDETNTWKKVIEKRSNDAIHPNSIHYKTFQTYSPDLKILYIISDIQTRIRDTIKNISTEFHRNHAAGRKIAKYDVVSEVDGNKVINNIVSSYDIVINGICNQALNINKFIDNEMITITCKFNKNLKPDMIRDILYKFSEMAMLQYKKKDGNLAEGSGDNEILTGYEIIISNIIQKSYRRCICKSINMKSTIDILETIQNTYSASRITDPGIAIIKNSVSNFVDKNCNSSREQTKTAIKLGFILYIILLSFKYGK